MKAEGFRKVLQDKFRLASARSKVDAIDQQFWIGYREAIMDIMAEDIKQSLAELKEWMEDDKSAILTGEKMNLSEDDIDTIERMLFQTNKLLSLFDNPHSHCLGINEDDYDKMIEGLNSLKKGCEITLNIQHEKRKQNA